MKASGLVGVTCILSTAGLGCLGLDSDLIFDRTSSASGSGGGGGLGPGGSGGSGGDGATGGGGTADDLAHLSDEFDTNTLGEWKFSVDEEDYDPGPNVEREIKDGKL